MVKESLVEIFLVAQDCVNFEKDPKIWGSNGCYGFPAAILLFSIADCIGSYVIGGKTTEDHFNILNDKNYYNLELSKTDLNFIYKKYRCLLTHNSAMPPDTLLDIGVVTDAVFSRINNTPIIKLAPFLEVTKYSLKIFLKNANETINNSQQLLNILG